MYPIIELWLGDSLGVTGFFVAWIGIALFSVAYIAFGYMGAWLFVGRPQFKKSVMLMMIPITFLITLIIIKGGPAIFRTINSMEAQAVRGK